MSKRDHFGRVQVLAFNLVAMLACLVILHTGNRHIAFLTNAVKFRTPAATTVGVRPLYA